MSHFTPEQLDQLKSLGIFVDPIIRPQSKLKINNYHPPLSNIYTFTRLTPLFIITGITIISFSGIVLLKSNKDAQISDISLGVQTPSPAPNQVVSSTNTSIQSYLLSSQQYFTKALQLQQSSNQNNQQVIDTLNQAIISASDAIKNFPNDYRGYYQRGKIYQSLIDSKPELTTNALSDFQKAFSLNSNSPEISRNLASVYARKGDSNNTIAYLNQTAALEPTKAQNFYDLAKIQQQTGFIQDAYNTYNKLIPLLSDPEQLNKVQTEKLALEKIISSNPSLNKPSTQNNFPTITPLQKNDDGTLLQASSNNGLIIASPETKKNIEVNNITSSNSLSGTAVLQANKKDITLDNSLLTSNSQVYVTILKGGKNQNLQVISKSDKSFTIGLDSSISEDIEFKWWIIN